MSLILSSLAFFSFKKDSASTGIDYHMKYKPDSVSATHTKLNYTWSQPNDTLPNMVGFQMYSNTNNNRNELGITVRRLGELNTGTYKSDIDSYIANNDYFNNHAILAGAVAKQAG